jgi:hypothetical protein
MLCVQPRAQLCVVKSMTGEVLFSLQPNDSLQHCQRLEVAVGDKGQYAISSHDRALLLWHLKDSSADCIATQNAHDDLVVCVRCNEMYCAQTWTSTAYQVASLCNPTSRFDNF